MYTLRIGQNKGHTCLTLEGLQLDAVSGCSLKSHSPTTARVTIDLEVRLPEGSTHPAPEKIPEERTPYHSGRPPYYRGRWVRAEDE